MASAKRIDRDKVAVQKTVTVYEDQPPIIQLELSVQEAETLRAIARVVGGVPSGRRGDMDRITAALKDAGVDCAEYTDYDTGVGFNDRFGLSGSVRFGPDIAPAAEACLRGGLLGPFQMQCAAGPEPLVKTCPPAATSSGKYSHMKPPLPPDWDSVFARWDI